MFYLAGGKRKRAKHKHSKLRFSPVRMPLMVSCSSSCLCLAATTAPLGTTPPSTRSSR